ncbi:hypothetical protein B0T09DRAFT_341657 [Sordaria sp. MPI-SDFR-AT-0083]|nr:hypothetical protein B0T09DRAFT_341657 [Sordaria sp. MPI-SDFR-AT-0083]
MLSACQVSFWGWVSSVMFPHTVFTTNYQLCKARRLAKARGCWGTMFAGNIFFQIDGLTSLFSAYFIIHLDWEE